MYDALQTDDRPEGERRGIILRGLGATRKRCALTQRELAALSGVSTGSVRCLEANKRGAYPRTLRKLAEALNVSPAALVDE